MPARAHLTADISDWDRIVAIGDIIRRDFAALSSADATRVHRLAADVLFQVAKLEDIAKRNRAKDVRELRSNPNLVQVLANPTHGIGQRRRPADIMSYDVQAIAYRHRDDDEFYTHVFGRDDDPRKRRAERMIERDPFLGALPEETGVMLIAEGNHLILRSQDANRPLSKVFA